MPAFLCGAVVAWLLQLLLHTLWVRSASTGCSDLRNMADALHAEVEVARQRLAECHEGRRAEAWPVARKGSEVFRSEELLPAYPAANPAGDDLSSLGRDVGSIATEAEEGSTTSAGQALAAAADLSHLGMPTVALALCVGPLLLLLDAGLVFFCLGQVLPRAAQAQLGALFCAATGRLRPRLRGGPAGCPAEPRVLQASSLAPQLSRIDPSGGAVLVRRRDRAAQAHSRRHTEAERQPGHHWVAPALAVLSLGGVAAMRLAMHAATDTGFRFLSHLLTYLLVTFRVCLIVLLVLF